MRKLLSLLLCVLLLSGCGAAETAPAEGQSGSEADRKSTRLNSSH